VINQIRAFLLERGLVFAQTPTKLKVAMADVLENAEADLTPILRNLIDTLWGEWKQVEQQIKELTDRLEQISATDAGCSRIRKIPASDLWSPLPSSRPSATALPSARGASLRHGSVSFPGSIRTAASPAAEYQ
jgi:hypothetical protein